jgi:hypothetical protein
MTLSRSAHRNFKGFAAELLRPRDHFALYGARDTLTRLHVRVVTPAEKF